MSLPPDAADLLVKLALLAIGALCGWAWHHGQIESAREDGRAEGLREGYTQGRADTVIAQRRPFRETHGTESLEATMDAANKEMSR